MNGLLITRETDYALRILRALSDGELLTAKALTQKEAVPHQFAYKILKKLEGAGLIRITRGRLPADRRSSAGLSVRPDGSGGGGHPADLLHDA